MKKTTLLLLFMSTFWSYAQVNSYSFTKSTTSPYPEITAGFALGNTTTDEQLFIDPGVPLGATAKTGPGLPINFNFTYNGFVYDKFGINANGWISLGTSTLTPSVDMTSTDPTEPLNTYETLASPQLVARIVPFGANLIAQTGSTLRYQTTGTAPNRILTIQWKNYALKNTSGSKSSFQIKLYETSNLIKFVYGLFTAYPTPAASNPDVQVGLRAAPDTALYNFVNRTSTTGWANTTAGLDATDSIVTNSSYIPANGLTFTWTPPTCGGPYNFKASAITTTGATLNWDSFLPAPEGYQYAYAASPTLPSGAGTDTIQPTAILAGLDVNTLYYVFLRSNCGSQFTPWILAGSFRTYCEDTASVIENFDSYTLLDLNTLTPGPALPACWTRIGNVRMVEDKAHYPNGSSPNMLQLNVYTGGVAYAILPPLSNLQQGTHRLRFKALTTYFNKFLEVGYFADPDDETSFVLLDTKSLASALGTFLEFTTRPQSIPAGVKFLAFRNSSITNGAGTTNMTIDDVIWEPNPDCPDVKNIVANKPTDTTAKLAWTPGNSETAWQYAYGPTTVINPDTLTPHDVDDNPLTLPITVSGLTPSTSYKIWVRSKCGDSLGAWIGPALFATTCSTKTEFSESFDSTASPLPPLPDCWVSVGDGSAAQTHYSMAATMPNAFYTFGYNTLIAIAALPPVSNAGAGTHRLRFKMKANKVGAMLDVGYLVDSGDANSFVSVKSFEATQTTDFETFIAELGTKPTTVNLAIRNMGIGSTGVYIYMDDVFWEPIPTCPDVTNVVANEATDKTVKLAWTPGDAETAWQYAYASTTVDDPDTVTPHDVDDNPTLPITVSGLTPSTHYKIWVRSKCGDSHGAWIGPIPFATTCSTQTEFSESFDSTANPLPSLPDCWVKVGTTGSVKQESYATAATMPNALFIYGSNIQPTIVALPPVSNAAAGTHRLRLKMKATKVGAMLDVGYLVDSGDANSFVSVTSFEATQTTDFETFMAELGTEPTANLAVRNMGLGSSDTAIYLDDVFWEPASDCLPPTALTVDSSTVDSASISWIEPAVAPENGYEYYYTTEANTEPVDSTTPKGSVEKGVTNVNLLSLLPETTYYVWVRSVCSLAPSPWTSSATFTTTSLSIDDIKDSEFSFYPNPVTDILNLSYKREISAIALFNLLGQRVIVKSPNSDNIQIDMTGLPKGAYLLKVTVQNQVKTLKVIKE